MRGIQRLVGMVAVVAAGGAVAGGCDGTITGSFAPGETPTAYFYPIPAATPAGVALTVGIATYADGRVFANGSTSGGATGVSYLLHFHRGSCGGPELTWETGPATSALVGATVSATFASIQVTHLILDGTFSADLHRVGDPTVLACGALR